MKQLKSFLLFVFTLSEFRWWLWRAKTQLLDEEVEKYHLRSLALQIGEVVGVSVAVTLVFFNAAVNSPLDNVPVVELVLPDTSTEIKVTAFAPGSAFDPADYCSKARFVDIERIPGAEVVGVKRVAGNSDADYVEWVDNNAGTNATRFFVWDKTAPNGKKAGDADHETVQVVTQVAVTCFRTPRGSR